MGILKRGVTNFNFDFLEDAFISTKIHVFLNYIIVEKRDCYTGCTKIICNDSQKRFYTFGFAEIC